MTMVHCKGRCKIYKAKFVKGGRRYLEGQKNCSVCGIFIRWDGLYCPCCGMKLRWKPRNPKYKKELKELLAQRGLNLIA